MAVRDISGSQALGSLEGLMLGCYGWDETIWFRENGERVGCVGRE